MWTALVVALVGGASYLGWRYASWEPTAPEPQQQSTTIKISAAKPTDRPKSTATTEISEGRFQITLPIPSTLPRSKKIQTGGALPEEGKQVQAVVQSLEPPETTVPAQPVPQAGPEGITETDLAKGAPQAGQAQAPPEDRRQPPSNQLPYRELEKPLQVGDLTIPPPQAVPPFSRGEKPVFILETERQGRTISVRGTTNLPVEGNGVQVSLFRLFQEGENPETKRAALDTRNLSLWFEGKFPVEDKQWLKARLENEKQHPGIFPAMSYKDSDSVQVEVIFTGTKKELGPIPGLTVYPIPGTDKQVYRIIRSVSLPAPAQPRQKPPRETPPLKKAEQEKPSGAKPLRRPGGPTRIKIMPLKWLDGPLQANKPSGNADTVPEKSLAAAPMPKGNRPLGHVLTYRF